MGLIPLMRVCECMCLVVCVCVCVCVCEVNEEDRVKSTGTHADH